MNIRPANEQDLLEVCSWFLTESDAKNWAGPSIHFPFDLAQLKIDIEWDNAKSYVLIAANEELIGFVQLFDKFVYQHLGRMVISPVMRGEKLGHKLLQQVLELTSSKGKAFSLFVYQHNIAAIKLYHRLGFKTRSYPKHLAEVQGCLFMVKETD